MTAHVSADDRRPPTSIRDSGGSMPFSEADFTRDAARLVAEGDRVPAQRGDTYAMTMTLTDFLLERIAEDEAVARQAEVDLGRFDRENVANGGKYTGTQGAIVLLAMRDANAMDPARVLAECAAKRAILEEWSDNDGNNDMLRYAFGDVSLAEAGGEKAMHWRVLRHLALPYAEHPDYRDEWRT